MLAAGFLDDEESRRFGDSLETMASPALSYNLDGDSEPLGVRQLRAVVEVERSTSAKLRRRLADSIAETEALKTAIECLNDEVKGYSAKEKELMKRIKELEEKRRSEREERAQDAQRFESTVREMKEAMKSQRLEHKESMRRFKLKYAQEQYLAKKLVS